MKILKIALLIIKATHQKKFMVYVSLTGKIVTW